MKIITFIVLSTIIFLFTNCSTNNISVEKSNLEKMEDMEKLKEKKKNQVAKHLVENAIIETK
jgi:uncharacterized membrane protein YjjP (DUF1212 family)